MAKPEAPSLRSSSSSHNSTNLTLTMTQQQEQEEEEIDTTTERKSAQTWDENPEPLPSAEEERHEAITSRIPYRQYQQQHSEASTDDEDEDRSRLILPYLGNSTPVSKSAEMLDLPRGSSHSSSNPPSQTSSSHEDSAKSFTLDSSSVHSNSSASVVPEQIVLSDTETSQNTISYIGQSPLHSAVDPALTFLPEDPEEEVIESDGARFAALNFVMEHRVFLKAALSLLAERDKQAPELGMMDPIIIKSGPLKKAAHLMNGVWKVKYVEIRRGMLSYYENAVARDISGEQELLRKDVPLTAATCTCRPVKLHQKALNFTPLGAIFELSVGGSKRLWMASTREERHTWMHAIHHAMVGGSVTRGDSSFDGSNHRGFVRGVSPRSPFKDDLRQYLKTQNILRNAKSCPEYVAGLRVILNHALQVPVKWIAKQAVLAGGEGMERAFREETIDLSVDQLWRDLQRDTINIDGELHRGDNGHGPERIVGALMRRILHVSQGSDAARSLAESQALAYARDALLAGNRTRTGGDSYFCINTLCCNDDMVVIVPSGSEVDPVLFEVSEDHSDHSFHSRLDSKRGWISTRNLLNRIWKRRFFVLSEGTLSYYEGAHPRPHGLKGQMFLKDAILSLKKKDETGEFVLSITINEVTAPMREILLLFDSEDLLIDWIYALECTVKSTYNVDSKKTHRRKRSGKGAEDFMNSFSDLLSVAEEATLEHMKRVGVDNDRVENRIERISRRTSSAVRISVHAWTDYKICTTDPQGDHSIDTWATIRTDFLQTLRVTGGPNGRITRGEEVVRISVMDCLDLNAGAEQDDAQNSPTRRKNRRLFRKNSSADGVEPLAPLDNTSTMLEKEAQDSSMSPQRRSLRTRRLFRINSSMEVGGEGGTSPPTDVQLLG